MVVSERYACFWSLFNLRFSLYDAQFIMLTLFKFTSFTFTTNLDFSLLFNPHLLWFLYLFFCSSVLSLSPDFPVRGWVVFCLTCKGRVVLHSDSDSVQENRRHKALFFAPWKCESGFGKKTMRGSCDWDTSVNNSCTHLQAWQPRQSSSLTPRLCTLSACWAGQWCSYSDTRAPLLQKKEKLGVTCLGQCWQPHALKRISLATAITYPHPTPRFFF